MTKLAMILGLALAISAPAFADETAAPASTDAPATAAPAAPVKTGKHASKHKRGAKKAKKGMSSDAPKAE